MGEIVVPTVSVEVRWVNDWSQELLLIFRSNKDGQRGVIKGMYAHYLNQTTFSSIMDAAIEEVGGVDEVERKGLEASAVSQINNLVPPIGFIFIF